MMKNYYLLLGSLLLCTIGQSQAEEDAAGALADVPEPPVLPAPVESGQVLEEKVRIKPGLEGEVAREEYSVNGRVWKVKVIPEFGPAYYLIDNDGDGLLETRLSDIYNDPVVPQWVLFTWD